MTTTKRISELPDASTLEGDEILPVVQDGSTRKTTVTTLRAGLALSEHSHELSDIVDAGTAAAKATEFFATAAQGAKADSAVQPSGLGSSATHPASDFATAAQGAKADSALQAADIGTAATKAVSFFASAAQGAKADSALQAADIGTAATHAAGDFATAAQGAKADTAVQPGSLGTASTHATGDFATAAQGTKADSAVQPGGLATIATSGSMADLLNAPIAGLDNVIINGCSRVSQRGSLSLSTSWQYGAIDLLGVKAEGTVSAGTIKQASAMNSLSVTGYAAWIDSATMTGSGAVVFRQRLEAKDVWRFINQPAYFSCRVYHDVGAGINFTVTIRRSSSSADDFTSVTDIGTVTTSIATATNSDLTLSIPSMGDCKKGVEIEIRIDCGAVTTKTFYVADRQLVTANYKRPFLARPFALEELLVKRYLRPCFGFWGIAVSASSMQVNLGHIGMRLTPNYEVPAAINMTDGISADFSQSTAAVSSIQERTKDHGRVTLGYFSGMTTGRVHLQRGTDRYILASAEFSLA